MRITSSNSSPINPQNFQSNPSSSSITQSSSSTSASSRSTSARSSRRNLVGLTSAASIQSISTGGNQGLVSLVLKAYSLSPTSANNYVNRELGRSLETLKKQEAALAKGIETIDQHVKAGQEAAPALAAARAKLQQLPFPQAAVEALITKNLYLKNNSDPLIGSANKFIEFFKELGTGTSYVELKRLVFNFSAQADTYNTIKSRITIFADGLFAYNDSQSAISAAINTEVYTQADRDFLAGYPAQEVALSTSFDTARTSFFAAFDKVEESKNEFKTLKESIESRITNFLTASPTTSQVQKLKADLEKLKSLYEKVTDHINQTLIIKDNYLNAANALSVLRGKNEALIYFRDNIVPNLQSALASNPGNFLLSLREIEVGVAIFAQNYTDVANAYENSYVQPMDSEITGIINAMDRTGNIYQNWQLSRNALVESFSGLSSYLASRDAIVRSINHYDQIVKRANKSQQGLSRALAMLEAHRALVQAKGG